jgi:hypothetical protein
LAIEAGCNFKAIIGVVDVVNGEVRNVIPENVWFEKMTGWMREAERIGDIPGERGTEVHTKMDLLPLGPCTPKKL